MKKFALTILITLTLSSKLTFAETSMEYALMGKKAWSAFECVALAQRADKYPAEQKRLFSLGYDVGNAFIQAMREGKIKVEDRKSEVPLFFTLLLSGPNNDFILGRLFEFIVGEVNDDIIEKTKNKFGKAFPSIDLQKTVASDKFWTNNCKLIK